MPLLSRLAALGALSALAACTTNSTTDLPVSADTVEVLAAAAGFTPTYEGDEADAMEAAESEGGLSGFVGRSDGTVVPVNFKIDREANTLTVTYGDEDPVAFDFVRSQSGSEYWSDGENEIRSYGWSNGFQVNDEDYRSYTSARLMTAPEDLPTSGEVGYTGYFNMAGDGVDAYGNLALAVDFGSSSVTGGLLGSLYTDEGCCELRIEDGPEQEGPSGDAFFASLEGAVENGILGASGDVSGTVTGNVSMIGGFQYDADSISGAVAGTIGGDTLGGNFDAWTSGGI